MRGVPDNQNEARLPDARACAEAWLVSLAYELSTDSSVAYSGKPPIVGCSRLVCGGCGGIVRHADNRRTPSVAKNAAQLKALYAAADPAQSPILKNGPHAMGARAYFCSCDWNDVGEGGAKWVDTIDQPWRCGGHGD